MLSNLIESIKSIVVGTTVEDRRSTARALCDIPISCQMKSGYKPAQMLDVSARGLRLEVDEKIRVGTPMRVKSPRKLEGEYQDAIGKVRWCRKSRDGFYQIGLDFEGKMTKNCWIPPLLAELGLDTRVPRQRRKHMRVPSDLHIQFTADGGQLTEGILKDLSLGGALVKLRGSRVSKGVKGRLTVGPFGGLKPMHLVVSVCRSDQKSTDASLAFANLTAEQQKEVARYLNALMKAARERR